MELVGGLNVYGVDPAKVVLVDILASTLGNSVGEVDIETQGTSLQHTDDEVDQMLVPCEP